MSCETIFDRVARTFERGRHLSAGDMLGSLDVAVSVSFENCPLGKRAERNNTAKTSKHSGDDLCSCGEPSERTPSALYYISKNWKAARQQVEFWEDNFILSYITGSLYVIIHRELLANSERRIICDPESQKRPVWNDPEREICKWNVCHPSNDERTAAQAKEPRRLRNLEKTNTKRAQQTGYCRGRREWVSI